jgi:hypothetical protein
MATKLKSAVLPLLQNKTDAFVDDDTFIPHFIKCFGKRTTENDLLTSDLFTRCRLFIKSAKKQH